MRLSLRARHAGFLLLEVLVALLLAGVAVLALAASQAAGLRATRLSQHRVLAMQLAADLGERLRANPAAAQGPEGPAGAYRLTLSWAAQQADAHALQAGPCEGPGAQCTPAQLAQADMAQWRVLLRRSLPGGAGFVELQPAVGAADVWVAWQDARLEPDGQAQAPAKCPAGLADASAGLRCVHLRVAW